MQHNRLATTVIAEATPLVSHRARAAAGNGQLGVPKLLVNAGGLSEMLSVSVKTLSRWADEGKMPAAVISHNAMRLWSVKAIEEWIAGGCLPVTET